MNGDRIEMSQRERDRLKVVAPVLEGRRTQAEGGRLLGRSMRQVRRIRRRLEAEADAGVVHRLRGRASNRGLGARLRRGVVQAYRRRYADFGPTLASERLTGRGMAVAKETLRRRLMQQGLCQRRRRRAAASSSAPPASGPDGRAPRRGPPGPWRRVMPACRWQAGTETPGIRGDAGVQGLTDSPEGVYCWGATGP